MLKNSKLYPALCISLFISACGGNSENESSFTTVDPNACVSETPIADQLNSLVKQKRIYSASEALNVMESALASSGYTDSEKSSIQQAAYHSVCQYPYEDYVNDKLDHFTLDTDVCKANDYEWCFNTLYPTSDGEPTAMHNEAVVTLTHRIRLDRIPTMHWADTHSAAFTIYSSLYCAYGYSQTHDSCKNKELKIRPDIYEWIQTTHYDKDDEATKILLRQELAKHPIITEFKYHPSDNYLKGCWNPDRNLDWPATAVEDPLPKLYNAVQKTECAITDHYT